MADFRGWSPFTALQIEYSLIERTVERELIPMAEALDLAVTPWAPLGGGVLTGKYMKGQNLDLTRVQEGFQLGALLGPIDLHKQLRCKPLIQKPDEGQAKTRYHR